MSALVVGVDPGLTTGVFAVEYALLRPHTAPIALQIIGSEGVVPVVDALVARAAGNVDSIVIAVEQFVVGPRASRSRTPHAGRIARALIAELDAFAHSLTGTADVSWFVRPAATVKPWATDRRLTAAGLLDATKAMPHARDAARHALYAAVHCGVATDPLSSKVVALR